MRALSRSRYPFPRVGLRSSLLATAQGKIGFAKHLAADSEGVRLRWSGGAHTGEELVDLDTQGIGLMLELAGVVAHHVRRLPGLAGRVGEAGDLLAHHAGALPLRRRRWRYR